MDRYTKVVLTVIAGALVAIAARGFSPTAAEAQSDACGGSSLRPCYVRGPIEVFGTVGTY